MILKRKYQDNYGNVLVLCDKDLYGKKFEEGDFVLDINNFFNGEESDDIGNIEDFYFIYAVGQESINKLKEKNIIKDEDIRKIGNIPFTFVLFI